MSDKIMRCITSDGAVMAVVADTSDLVYTGAKIHLTSAAATAALGRLLTAAAIMGNQLKQDSSSITLRIKGDDSVTGAVIAVSDSHGNVRGYVENPDCSTEYYPNGKLNVAKAVGKTGILNVMKDYGTGEPYLGQVELVSGEIGDDLANYFATSEQVPSGVGLGVLMNKDNTVRVAGGFIIQLMPFASEECISKLETNLARVTSVTSLLDRMNDPEEMLRFILQDTDVEITETRSIRFKCNCSRNRVEKALISMGKLQLEELIDKNEPVELNCQFCNTDYEFSPQEIKEIIRALR